MQDRDNNAGTDMCNARRWRTATSAMGVAGVLGGLVGCAVADASGDDNLSTAVAGVVLTPTSCAAIASASTGPLADGEYLLFTSGRPWVAYCAGMASSAPKEYVTLHRTNGANYAQYTAGGASPGTNVRTSYAKIRIDPSTLIVNTADQTFATSTGSLLHGNATAVTSMPYGVAMACDNQASGLANIDLQGTPFAIDRQAFVLVGTAAVGTPTFTADGQVVNLTGGGFCGYLEPAPGVFNPFNQNGGALPLIHL